MQLTDYIPVTHDDDYYTHDTPLFIGRFPYYRHEPRMVQGKAYIAEERYSWGYKEIIPLSTKQGTRHYVHLKPYVLEPQVFMTIGLYPQPKHYADQDNAIGEVLKTDVKGMRQHELGNAQAWYYPQDKVIVLWECFLDASFRTHPLAADTHMRQLWQAFEHWLVKQFPDATRIATPFNDPIAHSIEEYQAFLRALDYHPSPTAEAAFEKPIK